MRSDSCRGRLGSGVSWRGRPGPARRGVEGDLSSLITRRRTRPLVLDVNIRDHYAAGDVCAQ